MKQLFRYVIILIILVPQAIFAQGELSLQAAIDSALYHNLGLVISRNEAAIAGNNYSLGNAGMLPRLDLNAGTNIASNNLHQKFNTGTEINKNGVVSKAYNGQLALNWTLFDGSKMFATHEKLEILKDMGELNVRMRMEEITSDVVKAYSEIVRLKIILKGIEDNLGIYEERQKLADTRLQIGKASKSELLQAKIDFNIQKANLTKQQSALKAAKINLNSLLLRPLNTEFEVSSTLAINENLELKTLLDDLASGNKQLQFLRMQEQQKQQEVKEQQSYYYPKVNLNAGYNFAGNTSTQGLFLLNQSRGPVAGLTFNWNLYNGTQKKQVENSKLVQENVRLQYDATKNTLESMVMNAWQRYQDALIFAKTEQENFKLTEENLAITMARFKLGEATILELKDAQLSSELSTGRLAATMYDAKLAETELLFLVGKLVK